MDNQNKEENVNASLPVLKKQKLVFVIWGVIYPPILYLLISVLVQISAQVIFLTIAMKQTQDDVLKSIDLSMEWSMEYAVLLLMIGALLGTPLYLFLMWKDRKRLELQYGKIEYQKPSIRNWLLVILLAFTLCISLNGVISLSGIQELFPGFGDVAEAIYGGGFLIQILGVGIVAPIVEELLFRGLAYKRIENYTNWKVALILSSIFFGIYHMNVVQFIYATILGLVLAYLYYKFHTILAPILFHVVANTTAICLVNVTTLSNLWGNRIFEIMITIITGVIGILVLIRCTKIRLPQINT